MRGVINQQKQKKTNRKQGKTKENKPEKRENKRENLPLIPLFQRGKVFILKQGWCIMTAKITRKSPLIPLFQSGKLEREWRI